jgi:leader peptidase (prepilin peptidase)/N-methyltransferase
MDQPLIVTALILFLFGTLIGSFLNVCILRLPAHESITHPPSRCPACKAPIAFYDNIPLLSYVILRGRCRSCAAAISPRYFIVEFLTGVLAVALFLRFGLSPTFFVYAVFTAALVVISFIDLDIQIIPDAISLPGIVLGLLASFIPAARIDHLSLPPSPLDSFLGVMVGGGVLYLVAWLYELATGTEGMGGGDIKLLAMIGAFLGWPGVPLALFFASLVGALIGLALMVATGKGLKLRIPFGPFLCLGALAYLFFGRWLVETYFLVE